MSEVKVGSVVQYTLRLSDAQLANSVTLKQDGPYVRQGDVFPLEVSKVYPDNTVDGAVKVGEGFSFEVIFRPADDSEDVVEGTWKTFPSEPDFVFEEEEVEKDINDLALESTILGDSELDDVKDPAGDK